MNELFKKVKDFLGIDGVKLALRIPESAEMSDDFIEGEVIITSKGEKHVSSIEIKLIEKYQRGRKEEQLINEYELSKIVLLTNLSMDKDQVETISFSIPMEKLLSDMDRYSQKNVITKGLVSIAKKLKKVKSTYKIVATAHLADSATTPTISAAIKIK